MAAIKGVIAIIFASFTIGLVCANPNPNHHSGNVLSDLIDNLQSEVKDLKTIQEKSDTKSSKKKFIKPDDGVDELIGNLQSKVKDLKKLQNEKKKDALIKPPPVKPAPIKKKSGSEKPPSKPGKTHLPIDEVNKLDHTNEKQHGKDIWHEADILLKQPQWKNMKWDEEHPKIAANAVKDVYKRWPASDDGRVHIPIAFADEIKNDEEKMKVINEAIANYKTKTCIDFEETADESQHHIRIINDNGCYSYIGKTFWIADCDNCQPVSIGFGCEYVGTVEHEFMHALGFWHEQARFDRDDHVRILWDNIETKALHAQFNKEPQSVMDTAGQPYDIKSVMHYGSHFFAKPGTLTIVDKVTNKSLDTQDEGFSNIDLKQLNILYCGAERPPGGEEESVIPTDVGEGTDASVSPTDATDAYENISDEMTCNGLVSLGLCKYHAVCTLCQTQCSSEPAEEFALMDIYGEEKCYAWKTAGYCSTGEINIYFNWMAVYCKKTCFERNHADMALSECGLAPPEEGPP